MEFKKYFLKLLQFNLHITIYLYKQIIYESFMMNYNVDFPTHVVITFSF